MSKTFPKARIEIGQKIKELREEKGLSLRKMADVLNFDPTQYSRLEKGETMMRVDSLLRIAEHHKIQFAELFEYVTLSQTE